MASSTEQGSGDSVESQISSPGGNVINAPKFGCVVPNGVFVGGISSHTTESELANLFSKYGTVTNTKIISDRAGVSKGYGFVTFETEDEAQRLQTEEEPILLRDRRLNIAPAIKKQAYPRSYDTMPMMHGSSVPMAAGPLYRQASVPFYQNGMTFYAPTAVPPHPAGQPLSPGQSSVESPPGYQPGAFGGLAQNGSPSGFAFSYAPQSQMFYPSPFPYHFALEGGYQPGSEAMSNSICMPANGNEAAGGMLFQPAPYVIIQQPPPGVQPNPFYDPQNGGPMGTGAPDQAAAGAPMFFASPRGFEPAPLFFAENATPSQMQNASEFNPDAHDASLGLLNQHLVHSRADANHEQRALMPLDSHHGPNAFRGRGHGRAFRSSRGGGSFNRRPSQQDPKFYEPANNNNNNNENTRDRNNPSRLVSNFNQSRPAKAPPSSPSHKTSASYRSPRLPACPTHSTPNQSLSFPQVPQYPYVPGMRPQYLVQPMMSNFQSPRRGGFMRPRTNGRGKPNKMAGWYRESGESVTDEAPAFDVITPPITPRSPTNVPEDHLAQPMQNMKL